MIRPKPDIPERVPVLSFPSPAGQADLLFYEVRDGHLPKNKEWAYGDPHPDRAAFPNHELVYVAPEGGAGWQRWFYAARRQDQHLYNWQFSNEREWPLIVQTFIVKRGDFSVTETFEPPPLEFFPYPQEWAVTAVEERPLNDETLSSTFVTVSVTREQVLKRTVIGTTTLTSSVGSSTATVSSSFSLIAVGDYIEAQCYPSIGAKVDGVTAPSTVSLAQAATEGGTFSATITRYVENELVGREFDADTNKTLPYRRSKVLSSNQYPEGVQTNGAVVELQPVNALWSIKTTKQASGLPGIAVNGVASRTYQIVTNYAWPAVLTGVHINPVYADPGDIYSSITSYISSPVYLCNAYSGPCLADIFEIWTSKQPVVGGSATWDSTQIGVSPKLYTPTPMLPQSIVFNSPDLTVSVPECLHDYLEFWSQNFRQYFPATNFTRWPATTIAEVDLRPYQGGWLQRVTTVRAPSDIGVAGELNLSYVAQGVSTGTLSWVNPTGLSELKLDISTNPLFRDNFLAGFSQKNVLGSSSAAVTGLLPKTVYYARLTGTKLSKAISSNITQLTGAAVAEIELKFGTATVTNGSTFNLGTFLSNPTNPNELSFTVTNTGVENLTDFEILFTGANNDFFSVSSTAGLSGFIAPLESRTFKVLFNPTSPVGYVGVTMKVKSNAATTPEVSTLLVASVGKPEISVAYGGTTYASGSTITLPQVKAKSSNTYSFTVTNSGNGVLTCSNKLDYDSSVPYAKRAAWANSTSNTLLSSLDAGASDTFAIEFNPTIGGDHSVRIEIDNSDPDGNEDPYVINLVVPVEAASNFEFFLPSTPTSVADVPVSGNSASYNFGVISTADLAGRSFKFGIRNTGSADLTLSYAESGDTGDNFSGLYFPSTLYAANTPEEAEIYTTTVTFLTNVVGTKTATYTFTTNDPDTPTFTLTLTATGGDTKRIQVEEGSGQIIPPPSTSPAPTFPFPAYPPGTTFPTFRVPNTRTTETTSLQYLIRNTGSLQLHLGSNQLPVFSITGTNSSKFATTTVPVGHLEPLETKPFSVSFSPGSTYGLQTATVTLNNDDDDTADKTFRLGFWGYSYPLDGLPVGHLPAKVLGRSQFGDGAVTGAGIPAITAETLLTLGGHAAVSSDGRIAISDTARNRVLIWNDYEAATTGKAADIVLGQVNMTTGTAPAKPTDSVLKGPTGVAWYLAPATLTSPTPTQYLVVCDTLHNRVLIYKSPSTNGQAASIVLGQSSAVATVSPFTLAAAATTASAMKAPTGVFVVPNPDPADRGNQGKLFVADTSNNRVLVWSSFPQTNSAPATFVLGQKDFVTATAGVSYVSGSSTFPYFKAPRGVAVSPVDGKLYVADTNNHRVVVYNSIPASTNTVASGVLFQNSVTASPTTITAAPINGLKVNVPYSVAVNADNHLAVVDYNNNRVLIRYSAISDYSTLAQQPFESVLGQSELTTKIGYTAPVATQDRLRLPVGCCWFGNELLVSDSCRLLVYKP